MSAYGECLKSLLSEAELKGYLTFDNIMDITDSFGLSLSEMDEVSEAILLRGIIVYEEEPENQHEENLEDYSRVDYDAIFDEALEIEPELEFIISKIKNIPPPQYKEITTLTAQNAEGNEYARERLILLHLRIVIKIALSMTKRNELDLGDAVSSGFIGLINSVDKYNPDGFNAFQSYASIGITRSIQRNSIPKWIEFYFPVHYRSMMAMIKEKYELLSGYDDYVMSWENMLEFSKLYSDDLDIESDKIYLCLKHIKAQKFSRIYLDDITDSSEIEEHVVQFKIESDPDKIFFTKALKEEISKVLQGLTEREEKVLCMRFGLIDGITHTLEEVGEKFNVTRERVRQIEAKAFRKLKSPVRSRVLRLYWQDMQ